MSYLELPPGDPKQNGAPSPKELEGYAAPLYTHQPQDQELGDEGVGGTFLYYWSIFRRRKRILLLIVFLGAVAGMLSTVPQTPVYQARTSFELQAVNENFLNMRDVNPNSGAAYSPELDLQTQVKIIQSEFLLDRVAANLKAENRPIATKPSGGIGAWRRALGLAGSTPQDPREQLASMAARSVKVRIQPNTRLVEVFVNSTDAQFAADYANGLAAAYMDQNLEARWQTTQNTGDWLTRQMQDLKIKLEKSEEQLQAYARVSGLQFTSEKENAAEAKLRQLQEELSRAQSDRVAKQSKYELAVSAAPDALPEVLDSTTLSQYQVKLADLRRQVAELSATLTPANPKVQKLEAQAASLQSTFERERANIIARIRNEFEAARRRESLLSADYAAHSRLLSEQANKISHYNILKREVDTTRQMYESMLQRVKEAAIASALRASNIRVVDRAKPPKRPYRPSPLLNTSLGLLSGVVLGIAFVVLRHQADRSIQQPGETALYVGGASELAIIPSLDAGSRRLAQLNAGGDAEHSASIAPRRIFGDATASGQDGSAAAQGTLHSSRRGSSAYADSFRAAVTSILFFGQNGDRPRVLVITSASPGEGKTTVACNLAIALAEINRRVIVIDGDLRRPRVHEMFRVENSIGLTDLLTEQGPPRLVAQETAIPHLYVLPCGSNRGTHLLYSGRLKELIRLALEQFDLVLIDTPPMLQIADARVFGRCADGVVLVVRSGQTTTEAAALARRRFAEDGTRVLGTILNDWNPKHSTGYGYGYGYEYGKYYKSYETYHKET